MKKTIDLLNEIIEMGFEKEEVLREIDAVLDERIGFENRKALSEEEISDELYDEIVYSFKEEMLWRGDIKL